MDARATLADAFCHLLDAQTGSRESIGIANNLLDCYQKFRARGGIDPEFTIGNSSNPAIQNSLIHIKCDRMYVFLRAVSDALEGSDA